MLYVSGNSLGRKYCSEKCRYTITDSETGKSYETDNPSGAYGVADRAVVSLDKWDMKLLDIIQSTEVVGNEGRGKGDVRYIGSSYFFVYDFVLRTIVSYLDLVDITPNGFILGCGDKVVKYFCDMKRFRRFYVKSRLTSI